MQIGQDGLSHRLESLIEKLPEERRSPLRELLLSLLGPAQSHRDSLKRLEEKYLVALKEDENVLSFRLPQPKLEMIPQSQRRWSLKSPCLIESAFPGELFRMAFELHLKSARSVFISWNDIDPGSRQRAQALLELSSSTIFIPEILKMSAYEQAAILCVLQQPKAEIPLLMAGTHVPYADLQASSSLNRELLENISQAYLKLTKPVAQYKREGLIRYFLESLS